MLTQKLSTTILSVNTVGKAERVYTEQLMSRKQSELATATASITYSFGLDVIILSFTAINQKLTCFESTLVLPRLLTFSGSHMG